MQLRFIHAADIHLGYEQYNLIERANDFARAYLAVVDYSIEVRADFLLLAGDLFHRASADAWMLKQATVGLQRLQRAGVKVIAVEGNHDTQMARKNLSWLEFLCDQDLLYLLNIHIASNGHKSLVPWNEERRRGSFLDVGPARIYGMKYYGAATARHLEEIGDQLEPGGFTILMLHAGMEGQVPHMHGGLSYGQVEPLRSRVDYLALGHIHKRLQEEWIFNPGSTEINSMEEIEWPHGFFDVKVDTAESTKFRVEPVETPGRRSFHRLSVVADGCPTLEAFLQLAEEQIASAREIPEQAVIELVLAGVAEFRRQDVPLERLKSLVEVTHRPLVARVRNALVPPGGVSVRAGEHTPRAEIERAVVEQLVYQQGDYRDAASAWTRLVLDVKNMALEASPPAAIVDHVQTALRAMSGEEGPHLPALESAIEGPSYEESMGEGGPQVQSAALPSSLAATPSNGAGEVHEQPSSPLPPVRAFGEGPERGLGGEGMVTIAGEPVDGAFELDDF